MKNDKLTNDDKKVWKSVTKSVTPLGMPQPSFRTAAPIVSIKDIDLPKPSQTRRTYQAVLDLHGMTRNEAHDKLTRFLCIQKQKGHKCVLVITGKGYTKSKNGGPGILKRKVPLWLEVSSLVHSWSTARPEDGGEGALYVFLK